MTRLLSIAALLSVLMFATGAKVSPSQYKRAEVVTFEEFLHARAAHYGIADSVAFGLIRTESNWKVWARGKAGEVGLTQLLLSTARKITGNHKLTRKQLFDPFTNVELGLFYLASLRDKFHGNMKLALAAYNQGPGKVMRARRAGERVSMQYANLVLKHATQAKRAGYPVPVQIEGTFIAGAI
jgi:soluble lytic murein transglycosylase-like protein